MASFEYEAGSKMLPAKAVRSVFDQPLGVRDAIILHFTQCLAWCAETPSQRLTNANLYSSDLVYSKPYEIPSALSSFAKNPVGFSLDTQKLFNDLLSFRYL